MPRCSQYSLHIIRSIAISCYCVTILIHEPHILISYSFIMIISISLLNHIHRCRNRVGWVYEFSVSAAWLVLVLWQWCCCYLAWYLGCWSTTPTSTSHQLRVYCCKTASQLYMKVGMDILRTLSLIYILSYNLTHMPQWATYFENPMIL